MSGVSGTTILWRVEDPTFPGLFKPIAGSSDDSWIELLDSVDISDKENEFSVDIPGQIGGSIEISGLYIDINSGQLEIRDMVRDGVVSRLQRREDDVPIEEWLAICTSFQKTFPDDGGSSFSASFTLIGPPEV